MTLAADLDTWAGTLATATGLTVTRDPGKVYPPCLFIGLPDTVGTTIGEEFTLDVPVWLVAPGVGKQAGDILLNNLGTFLTAIPTESRDASAETLSINETEFHSYKITARLHIT